MPRCNYSICLLCKPTISCSQAEILAPLSAFIKTWNLWEDNLVIKDLTSCMSCCLKPWPCVCVCACAPCCFFLGLLNIPPVHCAHVVASFLPCSRVVSVDRRPQTTQHSLAFVVGRPCLIAFRSTWREEGENEWINLVILYVNMNNNWKHWNQSLLNFYTW